MKIKEFNFDNLQFSEDQTGTLVNVKYSGEFFIFQSPGMVVDQISQSELIVRYSGKGKTHFKNFIGILESGLSKKFKGKTVASLEKMDSLKIKLSKNVRVINEHSVLDTIYSIKNKNVILLLNIKVLYISFNVIHYSLTTNEILILN